ncbi:MAG: hypothetical protein IPP47_00505 [Bryobacterales bacterium]|nr:hypothetical protein [Bryobacterales bacterium]
MSIARSSPTPGTLALSLKSTILMRTGNGAEAAEARKALPSDRPIDIRGFNNTGELLTISQKQPVEGLSWIVSCINAGMWREADMMLTACR